MSEYLPYTDVIYRTTGYIVSDVDDARYPRFDIFMNENVMFHTLAEAEAKISELAINSELKNERVCFFINEVPVGMNCYPEAGQRIRSYTADGVFLAETKASYLEDKEGNFEPYYGREADECPFNPSDIVEVFRGDEMRLEIIVSLPVNQKFISQRYFIPFQANPIHPDYTDDSYTTYWLNDNGAIFHNHPEVIRCFPPTSLRKIPADLIDVLQNAYKEFSKGLE